MSNIYQPVAQYSITRLNVVREMRSWGNPKLPLNLPLEQQLIAVVPSAL